MGYNIKQNDDGSTGLVTEATSNQVLTLDSGDFIRDRVQTLTVSGAVAPGVRSIQLSHATVVVAATIADLSKHPGLLVIKNTSPSGTAAHTVTITTGTLNGTNKIATLDAPNECLVIYVDSDGNGTIVENVGSVGISGT